MFDKRRGVSWKRDVLSSLPLESKIQKIDRVLDGLRYGIVVVGGWPWTI